MYEELKIIHWPDPRLLQRSKTVETFNENLRALSLRMLELMREAKGVGLAAPQVGENIRLFVMNPTGQPGDDRVYVNPILADLTGEEEAEEGCLSLPGITVKVLRAKNAKIKALTVDGKPIEEDQTGYVARIWQHETDHLNGTLLIDRMGTVARLANKRTLSELKSKYEERNPPAAVSKKPVRR
jgi:peptide deformylase